MRCLHTNIQKNVSTDGVIQENEESRYKMSEQMENLVSAKRIVEIDSVESN